MTPHVSNGQLGNGRTAKDFVVLYMHYTGRQDIINGAGRGDGSTGVKQAAVGNRADDQEDCGAIQAGMEKQKQLHCNFPTR